MQPWLGSRPRETGCHRCGKPFRDGDVFVWTCRERTRRFDFDGSERAPGASGLIRYEEVSRAYPVCGVCMEALESGGHMGGAALRRLLLLLGGMVVLCLAAGPAVHRWAPNFVSAFYRDGSMGR